MARKTPKTYSIITTCKGRLDDLKQSLPRFVSQQDTEVIVVDYDCPQQCGDYVRQHFPSVKLVQVVDQPGFNLPEARNLGAAQAEGTVLAFLDADVLVAQGLFEAVKFPLQELAFGSFKGETGNSLRGSCLVRRADFETLGGYDELLSGYSGEDLDLYMRLRILGARWIPLGEIAIDHVIEQTREERLRFRPPNIKLQFLRGQLYQSAKELVMRSQNKQRLPLEARKILMAGVNRQLAGLYNGTQDFELKMDFPDRYKRGMLKDWEFSTTISVKARRKTSP